MKTNSIFLDNDMYILKKSKRFLINFSARFLDLFSVDAVLGT